MQRQGTEQGEHGAQKRNGFGSANELAQGPTRKITRMLILSGDEKLLANLGEFAKHRDLDIISTPDVSVARKVVERNGIEKELVVFTDLAETKEGAELLKYMKGRGISVVAVLRGESSPERWDAITGASVLDEDGLGKISLLDFLMDELEAGPREEECLTPCFGDDLRSGSAASGLLVVEGALCRTILVVSQDAELGKEALEFAAKRRVPARVIGFERALEEVERAKAPGLVVLVDCADFEQGLRTQKQIGERGVTVILLVDRDLTAEQQNRLQGKDVQAASFGRNFVEHDGLLERYLDMVLRYR